MKGSIKCLSCHRWKSEIKKLIDFVSLTKDNRALSHSVGHGLSFLIRLMNVLKRAHFCLSVMCFLVITILMLALL